MRDVNKYSVMCRCPIDLAMRIFTVISERRVPVKNSSGKTRDMGFSDYLVELATDKLKNVKPSAEARSWAKEILRRNTDNQAKDKIKDASAENKSRHLAIQTRRYFKKRVEGFQSEIDAIRRKGRLSRDDRNALKELEGLLQTAQAGYDKWNRECLKLPDRRLKG